MSRCPLARTFATGVLTVAAVALAACGGGDDRGGGAGGKRTPLGATVASVPGPNDRDCEPRVLATRAAPDETLLAKPGRYTYRVSGTRTLLGDRPTVKPLPRQAELVITRPRRIGKLLCFRVLQRLTPDLDDLTTFVLRGPDMYLTLLHSRTGGQITEIRPQPPALSFDADELEWAGSYRGPTSGRYAVTVVGRRKMRMGGRTVEAVGLDLRLSYRGEISGRERALRWFAPKEGLVVAASVNQERFVGLDRARLKFRLRLDSLQPR